MSNQTTTIRKIQCFLRNFGKNKILCHSTDNKNVSRMKTTYSIITALTENYIGKRDIYFCVNNGGTKKSDITEIVACYVDIDAGRKDNGSYLSMSEVIKKKKVMMDKINLFRPSPNLIVETRNGYQLYWLLNTLKATENNVKLWEIVQNKLHNSFVDVGSDSKVGKINQIMRVPFTFWQKPWTKLPKFETKLQHNSPGRYDISVLEKQLRHINSTKTPAKNPSWVKKAKITEPDVYEENFNRKCKKLLKDGTKTTLITSNQNIISETIDFLNEIQPQLRFKGLGFSAKQAVRLSNELAQFLVSNE